MYRLLSAVRASAKGHDLGIFPVDSFHQTAEGLGVALAAVQVDALNVLEAQHFHQPRDMIGVRVGNGDGISVDNL